MEKCLTYYACDGNFTGANIDTEIIGYSGKAYVSGMFQDGDFIEIPADIPHDGLYHIKLRYIEKEHNKIVDFLIDNYSYRRISLHKQNQFTEVSVCHAYLKKGEHSLKLLKNWANNLCIDCFNLYPEEEKSYELPNFKLNNPEASVECKNLMDYFAEIYGKKILSGQHTNSSSIKECSYIHELTGKYPALRGFDLLSYSGAVETFDPSEGKMQETFHNRNTVEEIIKWVKKYKGIATICWHWYSPIPGNDKSFYTKFTNFDLEKALVVGTPENVALLKDIDLIGNELLRLKKENIPILWRPLHEANGAWFWWGAKGAKAYKELYKLMYHRYTDDFKLNNLIWVWNAPDPEWYVGDAYCDIVSIDIYNPTNNYGPSKGEFDYLFEITKGKKPIALGENFPIPDPNVLIDSKTHWLYYMTWSAEDKQDLLKQNSLEHYQYIYKHPYLVTLEDLPMLYDSEK